MIDIEQINFAELDRPEVLSAIFHPRTDGRAYPSNQQPKDKMKTASTVQYVIWASVPAKDFLPWSAPPLGLLGFGFWPWRRKELLRFVRPSRHHVSTQSHIFLKRACLLHSREVLP